MKTRITIAALLALAVLASFGLLTAAADGPIAFLDNQPHQLAAGASTLYQFNYAVDNTTGARPMTTITLVNGTNSGVGFQVWTPDMINDMADNKPVGQGTPAAVDCNTGEVSASGGCQSPDLTWSGAFGESNTYFVLVTNSNNSPVNYTLKIQGSGVSLGPQTAAAPSAPAAAPAVSAASTTTDDPAKAAAIDSAKHTLPANSATWYSFNYGLNDDGSRPVKTITLANGAAEGLQFQVWAPDTSMQGGWFNNNPTGQGTVAPVNCDTGAVAGGGLCTSNDLSWTGAFASSGTYFVRVINPTGSPLDYTLAIQ